MPKILVVDDNRDTRELLHLYLSNTGFTVVSASNGREGFYLANAEHPDLIITDLCMPEMDGIEMIKQLRAEPEAQDVPILILTAHGEEYLDQSGANWTLNKPIHLGVLTYEVGELLKNTN